MRAVPAPLVLFRRLAPLVATLLFAAACRTMPAPAPAGPPPAPAAPAEAAPTLRLDDRAAPTAYELRLAIDPAQPTFAGEATIAIEVRRPTRVIWLNGRDLEITAARIESGSTAQTATVRPGGVEFVGFEVADPLPVGPATLHVAYTAPFDAKGTSGAFRQLDGDRWYAFSQFESIYARRAFPSFDEPRFKTPFRITIDAPAGNRAYANTPVERQGDAGRAGWTRTEFVRSLPLPTYLVAFAVGPFDEVPAGTVGATPLRILTLGGKAPQAEYASRVTAPILAWEEQYTGIAYPFGKLDSISVPQTVGFGAMENVGLITYVEPLILAPAGEETVGFRRAYSSVAAHEIGHQWFGDLVTMTWWNDIWLNESFATWFGGKAMAALEPEWSPELSLVSRRSAAMSADSLATARRIRQPIETEGDIENAFDAISYSKGGTLLSAFERWLGPEEFQRGIRHYLREYAYGNADASEFLGALEDATRPGVAAAFTTFLDQSGVPLVRVGLDCGGATPALSLEQTRYLPAGSAGETDRLWQIPVCARWGGSAESGRACTLLTEARGRLPLEGATQCPDWVFANDGGIGYYIPRYDEGLLAKIPLGANGITDAEELSLLADVSRLANGGKMPASEALDLAFRLGASPKRQIAEEALGVIEGMRRFLVPDALLPVYRRLIRERFGERARAAGLVPRPGESEDESLLRNSLLLAVGGSAADPQIRAEARGLALAWLDDHDAVPAESVSTVLVLAALGGDEALYDRYRAALETETDRRDRRRLIAGLSAFDDPALLQRTLELLLDPDFDVREVLTSLETRFWDARLAHVAESFLRQHYDELVARLPDLQAGYLVYLGALSACSDADAAAFESFFRPRSETVRGLARGVEQRLETIHLCAARRAIQLPEVTRFLEAHR